MSWRRMVFKLGFFALSRTELLIGAPPSYVDCLKPYLESSAKLPNKDKQADLTEGRCLSFSGYITVP